MTTTTQNPYHPGEREVQARADQTAVADTNGRGILDVIVPGAWRFLAAQPLAVLGSWDGGGNPWPTLTLGQPGFVATRDGRQVRFDLAATTVDRADPAWDNLRRNGHLSLLALEMPTRRRFRVNGRVDVAGIASFFDAPFEMAVLQAYPNCPKYIQRRTLKPLATTGHAYVIAQGALLSARQMCLVGAADTMFVASAHPAHGTDISHRGGRPGFVRIESPTLLRIPDYAGNRMFNTLGNIQASGVAGLLFVDFDSGRMLQISGDAAIDWRAESAGIERSWTLSIRAVRESQLPGGTAWDFLDASPFNPRA